MSDLVRGLKPTATIKASLREAADAVAPTELRHALWWKLNG